MTSHYDLSWPLYSRSRYTFGGPFIPTYLIIQTNKIIKAFYNTKLSLLPFAKAIDITGEGSFELIEADEIKKSSVETSLPDANWVSLQNICNN